MEEPLEIKDLTLSQSNTVPGEEATYVLRFSIEEGLPSTTAIRIETPPSVDIVRSRGDCYVNLSRKRTNVCKFDGAGVIEITKAFSYLGSSGNYTEKIEVVFLAENPTNTNNDNLQIYVEVYLDKKFLYKIAEVEEGLSPTFECEWPCKTCSQFNPFDCQSCFKGRTEREFLQEDRVTGQNTCISQC